MNLDEIDVKISLSKQNTGTVAFLKIIVPVRIDGRTISLSIDSFRIMTSQFKAQSGTVYKVLPPSLYSRNRYKDIVFFEDKIFWASLEGYILEKFRECLGGRGISNEIQTTELPAL
jgi:hypothetical protein